jgi:hypothetical protein
LIAYFLSAFKLLIYGQDYRQAELLKKLREPRIDQRVDIEALIETKIIKMMNKVS